MCLSLSLNPGRPLNSQAFYWCIHVRSRERNSRAGLRCMTNCFSRRRFHIFQRLYTKKDCYLFASNSQKKTQSIENRPTAAFDERLHSFFTAFSTAWEMKNNPFLFSHPEAGKIWQFGAAGVCSAYPFHAHSSWLKNKSQTLTETKKSHKKSLPLFLHIWW